MKIGPQQSPWPVYLPQPMVAGHPLNEGKTGWWPSLAETSGAGHWYDLLDTSPGTLTGFTAPAWVFNSRPGALGPALSLAGSQYITAPDARLAALYTLGAQSLGVAVWFKSTTTAQQSLVFWGTPSGSSGFTMILLGGSPNQLCVTSFGPHTIFGGPNAADGQWHCGSAFSDNSTMFLYLDGVQVATAAASSLPFTPTGSIGFGQAASGAANLVGLLDDPCTWHNNPLIASNPGALARLHYDQSRTGYPDSLNRYRPRRALVGSPPPFRPGWIAQSPVLGSGVY